MADYFTRDHFKLLKRWKGQNYDKSSPEQVRAYEELKQAYFVTELWANKVKDELFPTGNVRIIKKPINQGSNFVHYNWAKIYPSAKSPKALAYTVGIDAELGFVVKIDLVDSQISDPALHNSYERIRGSFTSSPIVAIKSITDGLSLDFTAIVEWSISAIKGFSKTYDDVAMQLGLVSDSDTDNLLAHFQGHDDFVKRQPRWSQPTTELFIRLAHSIHNLGLDWWFTRATNSQLRFGRKEKGMLKGSPIGSLFLRTDGVEIRWGAFAGLEQLELTALTGELIDLFETAENDQTKWPNKLAFSLSRNGYWPDDYEIESELKNEKKPKNVIYYGPPGTGKTFELQTLLKSDYTDDVDGKCYEFVTFHQSYGYEEFVEGLRPVISQNEGCDVVDSHTSKGSEGDVRYEIKPGVFFRLCNRARANPSVQYAMVIDEINRGNISKIFGELITLVEIDKREGEKNQVEVTLPYSGKVFSIPSNVDVIGTMNTADRSLALVDTALRRRFEFIESMPKPEVLADTIVSHNGIDISLERMLAKLNKRIEALYDRDHTVGHAYFTCIKDIPEEERFNQLKLVFKNKIIPLLEEYFFEDWQKIQLVLGDNQKQLQDHQFVQEIGLEDDLFDLFGQNHELDRYAVRPRYQLNMTAFEQPNAYVGIYE